MPLARARKMTRFIHFHNQKYISDRRKRDCQGSITVMRLLYIWTILLCSSTSLSLASTITRNLDEETGEQQQDVVPLASSVRYDYFAEIFISPPEGDDDDDDNFICGGTLISSDIVLTAAQCFVEGATALVRVGGSDSRLIRALAMTPHRDYNSAFGLEHDIMVIKLSERITSVQPMHLNPNINIPAWQQELTVMGFGATSELNLAPSDVLREATVITGSFVRCNRQYDSQLKEEMHVICTISGDGGQDSCLGDGGGPLILKGPNGPFSDVQVGIVSFGNGCGRDGSYSGYTSIAGHIEWILEHVCLLSDDRPDECRGCFAGSSMVRTLERGRVPLSDTKIGDLVLVGGPPNNNKFEPIYGFGHYNPSGRAPFLEIATKKTTLRVSSDHMVFVTESRAVPASQLQVGNEIVDLNGSMIEIVSIQTTTASGVFAPFTPSGKIVMDDVLSSCFVAMGDEAEESLSFFGMNLSYQWLAHTFESLHRIVCYRYRLGGSYCSGETYNSEGLSHWVATPRAFGVWILQQSAVLRNLMLGPILLILAVLNIVEQHPVMVVVVSGLSLLLSRRFQARKMKNL